MSVDWQVGNRFRTWMFFQESEQTKQGSWYEGTIVDLSLNTLALKKRSTEKRKNPVNNNNNSDILAVEPEILPVEYVSVPVSDTLVTETNLVPEEHIDDTLLIDAKIENLFNNVNTNNVETQTQPAPTEKPEEKSPEEKAVEALENTANITVPMAVEEIHSEPEKQCVSPLKIKIRVNPEQEPHEMEKEEKVDTDRHTDNNDQNELELINPWEMLVVKW